MTGRDVLFNLAMLNIKYRIKFMHSVLGVVHLHNEDFGHMLTYMRAVNIRQLDVSREQLEYALEDHGRAPSHFSAVQKEASGSLGAMYVLAEYLTEPSMMYSDNPKLKTFVNDLVQWYDDTFKIVGTKNLSFDFDFITKMGCVIKSKSCEVYFKSKLTNSSWNTQTASRRISWL